MTKKHFIALADILRDTRPEHIGEYDDGTTVGMIEQRELQWSVMLKRLGDFCYEQNPRFNRERWEGYIKGENGKNGGKIK